MGCCVAPIFFCFFFGGGLQNHFCFFRFLCWHCLCWFLTLVWSCFMFASAAVFFGKKEIKKVVISEVLLLLFPLHGSGALGYLVLPKEKKSTPG